jgi:2-keto-myo-inositol isomerase
MLPCISQATTLSTPFEADLDAFGRAGWTAVELWLTKVDRFLEAGGTLAEARRRLDDQGIAAAGASAQGGLFEANPAHRQASWEHFRRRLEIAQALGATTLVVVPDFAGPASVADLGRAIQTLAEASETARPFGIRLALEFQRGSRLCASLDTALALVAQAEASNLGICLDVFHYYTGPSKLEDLDELSPTNLAWVQFSDLAGTPRELATDADRVLPGDGDFRLGPLVELLRRAGYDGPASLEVPSPQLWAIPADRVADVARMALLRTIEPTPGDGPADRSRSPGGP